MADGFTPCSRAHVKHCSPAHAATVSDYTWARQAYEEQREREGGARGTEEYADWVATHDLVWFKGWLIGNARR